MPTAVPGFDGRGEPAYCGIVQAVGKVGTVQPLLGGVLRVMVVSERFGLADVAIGDHINVSGYSAKVVAKTERSFKFDLATDAVEATTGLEAPGNEVNLEKPMRPGTRVGGHVLGGQVDTVGEVLKFQQVGESWQLVVQVASAFAPCLAVKGSVAINGVSLTTNQVKDMKDRCIFSVNLIPHTLEVTALKALQPGHKVNIEVDMFARQLQQMMAEVELPGVAKSRKAAR
ncbi:MAG: riboflavin synthase [Burkholderiales bacterium]|nr:riboflavin synthase [Burkholderiales bacterium]